MEQFQFSFTPKSEEEAIKEAQGQSLEAPTPETPEAEVIAEPTSENPTETPVLTEAALEDLSLENLWKLYQEKVGINPELRGFDLDTLRHGVLNPEAELDRVREIDRLADKDDLTNTYR